MYFWKTKLLKNDLKNRKISEKESFRYLFAFVISNVLAAAFIGNSSTDFWNVVFGLMSLLSATIGTIYCYHCNKGDAGEDFVIRFLSLSWIGLLKLLVWTAITVAFIVIIFIIMSIVFYINIDALPKSVEVMLFVTLVTAYYAWLSHHIKDVANHTQ